MDHTNFCQSLMSNWALWIIIIKFKTFWFTLGFDLCSNNHVILVLMPLFSLGVFSTAIIMAGNNLLSWSSDTEMAKNSIFTRMHGLPCRQCHFPPPCLPLAQPQPLLLEAWLCRHLPHDCLILCSSHLLFLSLPSYCPPHLPFRHCHAWPPHNPHSSCACPLLLTLSLLSCHALPRHGLLWGCTSRPCNVVKLGASWSPFGVGIGGSNGHSICLRSRRVC